MELELDQTSDLPDDMTPEQRLYAVAAILARGVQRLRSADLSLPLAPAIDGEFFTHPLEMTGQTSVIGDRG